MTALPGAELPAAGTPLYDHAMRLHRLAPGRPLPRNGEPYPDHERHRGRPGPEVPRRRVGLDAAVVVDAHFARGSARPEELAEALLNVPVPIDHNPYVAAAAQRADPERVRRTGRWLVRRGTDRRTVTVGLIMLAVAGTAADIPLVRTIGLLSRWFAPLAISALDRLPGGVEALLWLGDRVTGWGRVHVVGALGRIDDPRARTWLLRSACDGDYLNRYFAGELAVATGLHREIGGLGADGEMADHVGRLLDAMTACEGMGLALVHYPRAAMVLEAHVRAVGTLGPTADRFVAAASLAHHLGEHPLEASGCGARRQEDIRTAYASLLDREEWIATAHAALAAGDERMRWFADVRARRMTLRASPGGRSPEVSGGCVGPGG